MCCKYVSWTNSLRLAVVVQLLSRYWLCDPMDCGIPGLPTLHHLLEFAQVQVHCISDAMQSSNPLTTSSPSALSLFQNQGLFQWVSSLNHKTKILELQHQSLQGVFRVDDWMIGSPCYPSNSQELSPVPQFEGINSLELCLFMVHFS